MKNYNNFIIIFIIFIIVLFTFISFNAHLNNIYNFFIDFTITIKNFNIYNFLYTLKINIKNRNKKKYILNKLPILAPYNRHLYKDWHIYYENIYGKMVYDLVDLNKFNWFYWNCPINNIKNNINVFTLHGMVSSCNNCLGMPYIITDYFVKVPETIASENGFFVNRNIIIDKNINKIEVFRVDDYQASSNAHYELYGKWFWITKGSGKFIDIEMEKTLILKDRNDWNFNIPFNECDKNSSEFLKKINIKYLIFTKSFSNYKYYQNRPELIVIN